MAVKIKGITNSQFIPLNCLHVGETFLYKDDIGMVIVCPNCNAIGVIDIETGSTLCDYDSRPVVPIDLEITYTIG